MKLLALSTIMDAEHIEKAVELPPFVVPASLYRAEPARAIAVVVPAMGTPAGYYRPFAEALAACGISALLAEIPGTGASRPRPARGRDYAYRDLYSIYLPGLVRRAREAAPGLPVVLTGHSLGAHVSALAVLTGSVEVDALITLAGGNIHYRNWEGGHRYGVLLTGRVFAWLAGLLGYLPGKRLGFGGPQAATLIREWAQVIRTGRYDHATGGLALEGRAPMLAIGFEGDTLAPRKSIVALTEMMAGRVEILPADGPGSPHSGWIRNPDRTVALIDQDLREMLGPCAG
jgi:predicted alpha/beta hydrolase